MPRRPPGTARASPRSRPASPCPAASPAPAGRAEAARPAPPRPTMRPACGPPTSLSPLNVTRSAPAARRSAGVGSWARPNAAVSSSAPLPRSSTTSAPCSCASRASVGRIGRLDEPDRAEVRRVDPQHQPRPPVGQRLREVGDARPVRRPDLDRAARRRGGRSRGSARRRRSRPAPRATTAIPPPTGQPDRRARRPPRCCSSTSASSAPVSAMRCSSATRKRRPRRPVAAVQLEERRSPGRGRGGRLDRRRPATAARPSSCGSMTPVALMTRARPAADSNAPSRRRDACVANASTDDAGAARGDRGTLLVDDGPGHGQHRARDPARRGTAARPPARARRTAAATPAWSSILRGLAGAHGSRTHRADAERRATGFEDRGAHRDPSAPTADGTAATTPATRSRSAQATPRTLAG